MIAIETKFVGPTDFKGARIIATTCNGQRLVEPYNYGLSGSAPHRVVAERLATKMGWKGTLIGGGTKTGYVFVFADSDD